jgi:SAM-dependent methyltransferase|tara:strand:+ start:43 stop:618 length:576 start_codon:yes stop_codon:yes gene_type:complete
LSESKWSQQRNVPRGFTYDERWQGLADSGQNIHGEADFISGLKPASVLDAGCGTGRVAIELVRRGIDCVGVDLDREMLAAASQKAPTLDWVEADLKDFNLGRTFDIAVLAGNVMIFVLSGSEELVINQVAHHLCAGGLVVAGFSLDAGGISLEEYDALMNRLGLSAAGRWSTWQREPFTGGSYAVSAHRKR